MHIHSPALDAIHYMLESLVTDNLDCFPYLAQHSRTSIGVILTDA